MIIKILYESKYSLGTTRNGENFITSMDSLKQDENKSSIGIISADKGFLENLKSLNNAYPQFQYNDITQNTVVGILCRLVGDIRRLNDITDNNHPIMNIKEKITFENHNHYFQNELITLHTPDKDSGSGRGGLIIKNTPLMNNNDFSESLLSVFNYTDEITILSYINNLINKNSSLITDKHSQIINLSNIHRLMKTNEEKFKGNEIFLQQCSKLLNKRVNNIHGILLYERLKYLQHFNLFTNEISQTLTKNSNLPGIASTSGRLTPKDFYGYYVKENKTTNSIPYALKVRSQLIKKGDKLNYGASIGVTKEGGELIINIDINKDEALILQEMIQDSGVSTFHMGKKGLAYINEIRI